MVANIIVIATKHISLSTSTDQRDYQTTFPGAHTHTPRAFVVTHSMLKIQKNAQLLANTTQKEYIFKGSVAKLEQIHAA